MAERGTFNPCVLGSNPSGLTRDLNADRPPGATSAGRRFPLYPWRYPSAAGVVAARSLIFMGVPVDEAIAAVRAARGSDALFNEHFVAWLHVEAGRLSLASRE